MIRVYPDKSIPSPQLIHSPRSKIQEIPEEYFYRPYRKLEKIVIENNHLQCLSPKINHLSLKILDLTRNSLTSLPKQIGEIRTLEELYLAGNKLQSVPKELGNLTSLKRFFINHNHLTSVPKELGNLSSLEAFSLGPNPLKSLPEELGALSSLKELWIDGSEIVSLPKTIAQWKSLEKLHADSAKLQSLPKEIEGLSSLTYLSVTENSIKSLPQAITKLFLEVFDLRKNPIKFFPKGFEEWKKSLKTYNASNIDSPPLLTKTDKKEAKTPS